MESEDAIRERNPLLEQFFQESVKKIAAMGARVTEDWWIALHPRLVNNPTRWRALKKYVDGAIKRGERLIEPVGESGMADGHGSAPQHNGQGE